MVTSNSVSMELKGVTFSYSVNPIVALRFASYLELVDSHNVIDHMIVLQEIRNEYNDDVDWDVNRFLVHRMGLATLDGKAQAERPELFEKPRRKDASPKPRNETD